MKYSITIEMESGKLLHFKAEGEEQLQKYIQGFEELDADVSIGIRKVKK